MQPRSRVRAGLTRWVALTATAFAKRWDLVLGLLLSVSVLWPLVAAPYFVHDDDVQTIRIYEVTSA